eukprot:GHVO01054592.1.p1 GENE.GHVO01054592.1~~GHVO01054592.1.p1  ORF type:complete len:443 (+),score=80.03 GHVO01054592.1:194-1330(+)
MVNFPVTGVEMWRTVSIWGAMKDDIDAYLPYPHLVEDGPNDHLGFLKKYQPYVFWDEFFPLGLRPNATGPRFINPLTCLEYYLRPKDPILKPGISPTLLAAYLRAPVMIKSVHTNVEFDFKLFLSKTITALTIACLSLKLLSYVALPSDEEGPDYIIDDEEERIIARHPIIMRTIADTRREQIAIARQAAIDAGETDDEVTRALIRRHYQNAPLELDSESLSIFARLLGENMVIRIPDYFGACRNLFTGNAYRTIQRDDDDEGELIDPAYDTQAVPSYRTIPQHMLTCGRTQDDTPPQDDGKENDPPQDDKNTPPPEKENAPPPDGGPPDGNDTPPKETPPPEESFRNRSNSDAYCFLPPLLIPFEYSSDAELDPDIL